jgi:hypothetical protein
MNIFQFFSLLTFLENRTFLKIFLGFFVIEIGWNLIQSLRLIKYFYSVISIILFSIKIILGLIGLSPFLYLSYIFVIKTFRFVFKLASQAYTIIVNLGDEKFLSYLKNQSSKVFIKRKSKFYSKIDSFDTLESAFLRFDGALDGEFYRFR